MIFDDHFERIQVISLPRSADRAERALTELHEKGLSDRAGIFRAIDGRICEPSAWWPTGGGAWGCLLSHFIAVTQALNDGVETLLLIEDDCIWQRGAAALAEDFLAQVPDDWGQIYFGGQHRGKAGRPEWIEGRPAVLRAKSVHRTHAYAIHRKTMRAFLQHILYAPDYIQAKKDQGKSMHVDHQLENAHRRGDWPVYAPSFWLAGQGSNHSTISGKELADQWWHWGWKEGWRQLPLVIATAPVSPEQMRWLHFGAADHRDKEDKTIDVGVQGTQGPGECARIMEVIASEALAMQRLPAMHAWPDKVEWIRNRWEGPVLELPDSARLEELCDYPASKVLRHPWINPEGPVRVVEVTDSVSMTSAEVPTVHQIWLGERELDPRLAAYCEGIRRAFPGWNYRMWRDADVEELLEKARFPKLLGDPETPVGLKADVLRLEILRQVGGVYLDVDFEALRDDLRPLFLCREAFYYADELSGRPANGMMAALKPGHPFVEAYLQQIGNGLKPLDDLWETVKVSGPEKLAKCLNFWVGDWGKSEGLRVGDEAIGNLYGGGIAGLWREVVYPYHYKEATWATFDPETFPAAWLAHHWEGSWIQD